jgi:hypothetical protein
MKTLTHTKDSLRLIEFLKDYPDQWHSIQGDKQTTRALERVIALHPEHIETVHYDGYAQTQIKYHSNPEFTCPETEGLEGVCHLCKTELSGHNADYRCTVSL